MENVNVDEMEEKVLSFPVPEEDELEEATMTTENSSDEKDEEGPPINPENPSDEKSLRNMMQLVKQVGEMLKIMEATWLSSKEEFQLTDSHMKQLYQFNEEHKEEMPEYLTKEEKEKWDYFNGLDAITEEDVEKIFGKDHPIIGVMHTQTIDRIKMVTDDFFTWMTTLKEYSKINDAYLEYIEVAEEENMTKLQMVVDKEEDPGKKHKMQESIDTYYHRKYLDFLAEPIEEKDLNRLVKAFSDKKKIEYWLNRSQDKLKQLKISTKFILEISQFEKRFLDEKYHKLSNMLLLYFMQTVVYCDCSDKNDAGRNKAVCMVLMLDRIVRNITSSKIRERVMNNIIKFEDQFMDKINIPTTTSEENTEQ